MSTKKKPTGFVATCQCGIEVGAMDFNRTNSKDAGRILGGWLADGCTITPMFSRNWGLSIGQCACEQPDHETPATGKEHDHG